jgi:hypothetical protein
MVIELPSFTESSTSQRAIDHDIKGSETRYAANSPTSTPLLENHTLPDSSGAWLPEEGEKIKEEIEDRGPEKLEAEDGNVTLTCAQAQNTETETEKQTEHKLVTTYMASGNASIENGTEGQVHEQRLASNRKSESCTHENVAETEIDKQPEDKSSTADKKFESDATVKATELLGDDQSLSGVQNAEGSVGKKVVLTETQFNHKTAKTIEELDISPPVTTECGVPYKVCRVYNDLFLMMHQKTPDIDPDDVLIALEHIELLIRIANYYRCLELIRPYMRDHLLSFGKPLYKAILRNSPRWLRIAICLESISIFQEAIVHIVGQSPYSWEPVIWSCIPDDVVGLIGSKVDKLRDLQQTIDRKLTLSGIAIDRIAVPLHEQTFETWLIEGYWRDWFIQALSRADGARKRGEKNVDAAMYRLMAKGGDAYVPIDFLIAKVKGLGHKIHYEEWDWHEAAKDLNLMTDYAQKLVKPLCVNHSMLDLDEECIEYLTCTKVESDELPWMNQGQN